MRQLAHIVECMGFGLYALPFLIAATAACLGADSATDKARLVRLAAIGPALGLALGACIFGALSGIWMDTGAFSWAATPPLLIASQVCFGLLWVSNIFFEIWTLDAVRATVPSQAGLTADIRGVHRHLWVHTLLILSVLGLSLQT